PRSLPPAGEGVSRVLGYTLLFFPGLWAFDRPKARITLQ
ncbi:hypothetical protein ABIE13_005633, partial [Ottowia thiooxydans]